LRRGRGESVEVRSLSADPSGLSIFQSGMKHGKGGGGKRESKGKGEEGKEEGVEIPIVLPRFSSGNARKRRSSVEKKGGEKEISDGRRTPISPFVSTRCVDVFRRRGGRKIWEKKRKEKKENTTL